MDRAETVVWLHTDRERPSRAHELLSTGFNLVQVSDSVAVDGLRRFHLWSTSSASDAALQLAAEGPERLETLVLEAPSSADETLLSQIKVPTLVIFGTCDPRSTTGRIYREKMATCQFVLVYDAGQDVSVDRPEAFSSLVADFLNRRDAFIVNQRSTLINP
ncbi:MAG: hypothetical protein JO052_01415 [Bradyrhizobium sp.]|nr:hypothetical protein [Bradyrhizobium sp.]